MMIYYKADETTEKLLESLRHFGWTHQSEITILFLIVLIYCIINCIIDMIK